MNWQGDICRQAEDQWKSVIVFVVQWKCWGIMTIAILIQNEQGKSNQGPGTYSLPGAFHFYKVEELQSICFKSFLPLLWSCMPLCPSRVCNHSENFLPWNNDADSEERNEFLWIRICKAQYLSPDVWDFGEQKYIILLTQFSSQGNELVNERIWRRI